MIKIILQRTLLALLLVGCFSTSEAQIFKKKKKTTASAEKPNPKKGEIDVPINYADYYYLEAMLRLKNLN